MKSYRVMIVEDDPYSRELITHWVSQHRELDLIAAVGDGNAAFELLRKRELSPIDLLLLDINLPDMTGIELLEKLDDIPFVIFTTAYEQYAIKAFQIGAIDYLLKPISLDRFHQAIDRFILFRGVSIPYDSYRAVEELKGTEKYKKSSLTQSQAREYAKRLLDHMETTRVYTDCDLTLKQLAAELAIPGYHLSQVINTVLKTNFYMFLNSYRIDEAKRLMLDPANRDATLLDLSLSAGFKSKSVFNQVFREIVGVTPRHYREQNIAGGRAE